MEPRRQIVGGLYIARPLQEFTVRVTLPTGRRLEYRALAPNSLAAFESALETHGITRIVVFPSLRRIK